MFGFGKGLQLSLSTQIPFSLLTRSPSWLRASYGRCYLQFFKRFFSMPSSTVRVFLALTFCQLTLSGYTVLSKISLDTGMDPGLFGSASPSHLSSPEMHLFGVCFFFECHHGRATPCY